MKSLNKILIIFGAGLIILALWGSVDFKKSAQPLKSITILQKTLQIEIADTEALREQGLSDRENLCSNCGLLFVFDKPGIYPFWMRRMLFDIDILWLEGDKVVDITFDAKVPPKEELEHPQTLYQSKTPVDKVLEVNAGWVEKNGIKIGDVVKY